MHRSPTLTIQHGIFAPRYAPGIHDHTVSAVIGTWSGYADNRFFRRAGAQLDAPAARDDGAAFVQRWLPTIEAAGLRR